jgi:hypothetical protein
VAPLGVSGLTIGYAAMDWADSVVEIPGAEAHPSFPAVCAWATCGAVFGGAVERAAALVARVDAAEDALGIRPAAAGFGFAVLPFFRGDLEVARARGEEWVERARESGDAYELGSALCLYAATLQDVDPDAATAAIDEAVRIGREAGIASVLSTGLVSLAAQVRIDSLADAPRALALLDEAMEVGMAIGDRTVVTASRSNKAAIAGLLGDWTDSLRMAAVVADEQFQLGLVYQLPVAFQIAMNAFCALGHAEPAAVLMGAGLAIVGSQSWPVGPLVSGSGVDATEAVLHEQLGEPLLRQFSERGAAMDVAVAVAFLRSEADRVLGDPSTS